MHIITKFEMNYIGSKFSFSQLTFSKHASQSDQNSQANMWTHWSNQPSQPCNHFEQLVCNYVWNLKRWNLGRKTVATQLWPSVGVKPNTSKVGDLESSGTPECLEFDSKAQNTSHWGVLGVIGKVLKRRDRKWTRIGHLDIYNPSYGQKKGRESNWQFDSRPLKVGNRPLPDIRFESATRRWKDIDEGYNLGSDLVAIWLCSRELWAPKVLGLQLGSPGKKSHLDVASAESCREYYKGEGGGFPRIRAVVSQVSPNARGLSQHPKVS
jgi:hypothetical protein